MNGRDVLAGLFWLGFAVFVAIESVRSDTGSIHSPGPGFVPFWSAVALGALSILLVVTKGLKKKWEGRFADPWRGMDWAKVIWILLALCLYTVFLPVTGYLVTTFALIAILLCIGERSKLWVDFLSALAIAVVSYVVFYKLLDVKLPTGVFGF